jgi:hypothetical protein
MLGLVLMLGAAVRVCWRLETGVLDGPTKSARRILEPPQNHPCASRIAWGARLVIGALTAPLTQSETIFGGATGTGAASQPGQQALSDGNGISSRCGSICETGDG